MPLGTEPTRHCVRCGLSYPQKKGTSTPPNFWLMSIVAKYGWMGEDAAWYGSIDLGPPGHIVLDGVPAPAKGAQQPPFRPMFIVARVAHRSYC